MPGGLSRSVMPSAEDSALCLTSVSTMSLYFVTDQKGPTGLSLQ